MRTLAGIALGLIICCAGCGGGGPKKAPLHPVTGKVTSGGKPLTGVTIVFVTQNQMEDQEAGYSAKLGSGGEYELMDTATNKPGCSAGKFKVTFVAGAESAKAAMMGKAPEGSSFPKEYSAAQTSPLEKTVEAKANVINIDI